MACNSSLHDLYIWTLVKTESVSRNFFLLLIRFYFHEYSRFCLSSEREKKTSYIPSLNETGEDKTQELADKNPREKAHKPSRLDRLGRMTPPAPYHQGKVCF